MTDQDPTYIVNLLDQDYDHNLYFLVGDPRKGNVERIGVVSTMLMAHSLVCRRAMADDESELEVHWDVPLTDVTPKTFKNMMKYCYGYYNLNKQTLPELVDLVKIADRWWMFQLKKDLAKAIKEVLMEKNITAALFDPICLRVQPFEEMFVEIIKKHTECIMQCPVEHLVTICPENMRYIVKMDDLEVTKGDVWRFIVKWARMKVLDEHEQLPGGGNGFDKLVAPRLIQCSWAFSMICALNLIQLVDEACLKKDSGEDISFERKVISIYHCVPNHVPKSPLVCTSSHKMHITHEQFDVKEIYDTSDWMKMVFRRSSQIIIYTARSSVEIHSIICSSCRKRVGELNFMKSNIEEAEGHQQYRSEYDCLCSVKTTLCSDVGKDKFISVTNFSGRIELDKEFEIVLHKKGEKLILSPERKYKIEINFSIPHPMWFENGLEYFPSNELFDVKCGQISKLNPWYGSHAKYILYRKAQHKLTDDVSLLARA